MFKRDRDLAERSRSLMKNKEVKKLKSDLLQHFPNISASEIDEFMPNKCAVTMVKLSNRSLLYLKDFGEGEKAIFFDVEGRNNIYPTVLSVWMLELVPPLFCHCPVSEFVINGADVMLPGVAVPQPCTYQRGEKRCVVGIGNPHPFAIGDMAVDANDIAQKGKKGKALKVIHYYGDKLWEMFIGDVPNEGYKKGCVERISQPSEGNVEQETDEGVDEEKNKKGALEGVQTRDSESSDPNALPPPTEQPLDNENGNTIETGNCRPPIPPSSEVEHLTLASQGVGDQMETVGVDMDALLEMTFFRAVKGVLKDRQLPILSSTFFSSMLLPARPQGTEINVKKTQWKKFGAFLQHMKSRDIIQITEKNGVQSITAINRNHPDYRSFRMDAEEKAQVKLSTGVEEKEEEKTGFKVVNLYKIPSTVSKHLGPSFASAVGVHGSTLLASEVRALLLAYVTEENLEHPTDRRNVVVNGPICDACFRKGKKDTTSYPTEVPKDELLHTLLSKLQVHHAMRLPGETSIIIRKGRIQPVVIEVEKRQGNKHMTKVRGLETYGISPEDYAREAQRLFASSSCTEDVPGKNNKNKEVLIQGHLARSVMDNLVETYFIPAKLIEINLGRGVKSNKKR